MDTIKMDEINETDLTTQEFCSRLTKLRRGEKISNKIWKLENNQLSL